MVPLKGSGPGSIAMAFTGASGKFPVKLNQETNSGLAGGGGVDGAIHRAGGPEIMHELDEIRRRIGGCPAGGAVVTWAGKLPAKYVFHAVGPVYRDGVHG